MRDQALGYVRQRFERKSEMLDFDVESFVAQLDRMGMKLTAIPLADGKLRVNRWCTVSAVKHAQEIQDLWTVQIGEDQGRIDVLADHLAKGNLGILPIAPALPASSPTP
jgi:hypothetical protein